MLCKDMIPGGLALVSRKSIISHVLLCARPYRVRGASDRKLGSVWTSSRRRGRSTVFSRERQRSLEELQRPTRFEALLSRSYIYFTVGVNAETVPRT